MKIIYRLYATFFNFLGIPLSIILVILIFLQTTVVSPVVYIFTGKTLITDYIYKLIDGYCKFVDELQRKGDYEQADNSVNEER